MKRVAVAGASGKMGSESVKAIEADPGLQVVALIGRGDDLPAVLKTSGAQIAVDFTIPAQVEAHLSTYLELGVHPIIGTTGLSDAALQAAQSQSEAQGLGGLIAPNFAIGAVLMMQFARKAAHYMKSCEITEMHHTRKLDAPSGTALRTAELIAEEYQKPIESVPIHSVRLEGYVASQEVIFGQSGERLQIRHDSIDRKCFMPGVVTACHNVDQLNRIEVGLEHVLKLD